MCNTISDFIVAEKTQTTLTRLILKISIVLWHPFLGLSSSWYLPSSRLCHSIFIALFIKAIPIDSKHFLPSLLLLYLFKNDCVFQSKSQYSKHQHKYHECLSLPSKRRPTNTMDPASWSIMLNIKRYPKCFVINHVIRYYYASTAFGFFLAFVALDVILLSQISSTRTVLHWMIIIIITKKNVITTRLFGFYRYHYYYHYCQHLLYQNNNNSVQMLDVTTVPCFYLISMCHLYFAIPATAIATTKIHGYPN